MMFLECSPELTTIVNIVKAVLNIIWIGVPIILIIMGTLDLAKAVATNDDKVMKEATSKLAKRAAYAVGVFFVVLGVKFVMNTVSTNMTNGDTNPNSFIECWNAGKSTNNKGDNNTSNS